MGTGITHPWHRLFSKRPISLLMVGLSGSGKISILHKLRLGEVTTVSPTVGFNVHTVTFMNVTITAWDVGGEDKLRPLYRQYYPGAHSLLFVLDASDHARLSKAKDEFTLLLAEPELSKLPILVFVNKSDLPTSLTIPEAVEFLELPALRRREWFAQSCNTVTGEGLSEGIEWVSAIVKQQT